MRDSIKQLSRGSVERNPSISERKEMIVVGLSKIRNSSVTWRIFERPDFISFSLIHRTHKPQ